MDSLYWLMESLAGIPLALWVYLGVGIPWTLAILPRQEWGHRALVGATTFAVGPAWLTLWMFVLGTLASAQNQPLLRFDLNFIGTLIIAIIGMGLAWRKSKISSEKQTRIPFAFDEKLILVLIVIAVILRWVVTAFWTFTAYDALWVYGFEGRLYFLTNSIPQDIAYYPQFVPLQYTFLQLAYGSINDHVARMVIPMMHIGSILASYSLGARLFSRRVGLILAGIWALHPHTGQWAFIGDLEIPMAFLFTLSATFFLMAWTESQPRPRRHYALFAGVMFGITMWTKPTAGAFIWGVLVLVVVALCAVRFRWRAWLPRFEVAFLTGIACIPLGALWYIRNLLLGHPIIELPPSVWLDQARRSGDHFNWFILASVTLFIYLWSRRIRLAFRIQLLLGIALLTIGSALSNPLLFPARFDPPSSRIEGVEWLFIIVGFVLIIWSILQVYRQEQAFQPTLSKVAWALLLALPYFFTYFYSYSYHYRLSFAIVPLLILPSAVFLAQWLTVERYQSWQRPFKFVYIVGLLIVFLPGTVATLFDFQWRTGWLWSNEFPNERSKYLAYNPSLMLVVDALREYEAERHDLHIIAPGEQRLRFFFPTATIIDNTLPTQLAELSEATHYIYGTQAEWRYADANILPSENQIVSALGRADLLFERIYHDQATFRYELYQVDVEKRMREPDETPITHFVEDEIVFGASIRFVGENIHNTMILETQRVLLEFLWEVIAPTNEEYGVFIHLIDSDGVVFWEWDAPIYEGRHGHYRSTLWEAGELILDRRFLQITDAEQVPNGRAYRIEFGFYHLETGERLPVTVNDETAGDSIQLEPNFTYFSPRDESTQDE